MLWSGEEQGLFGSQEYVKEIFGAYENPKPAFEKFGGYFNIDSGTGRIRGAFVFGPPEAAKVLRDIPVVVATAVYHLAMRDELLPRFTKDAMPPFPNPPANSVP